MTKGELRQMIREVLREELANKSHLREASGINDQAKKLKRMVLLQLADGGLKNVASQLNSYNFVISDTIKPGTVEINGNTIVVHSDFLNENMYNKLAAKIARVITSKSVASAANGKLVYVLTTFRGKELIYDDFYDAVIDAEGDLVMEANMIDTMYQAQDGTLTAVPETDPNYHRWTEEEGIRT